MPRLCFYGGYLFLLKILFISMNLAVLGGCIAIAPFGATVLGAIGNTVVTSAVVGTMTLTLESVMRNYESSVRTRAQETGVASDVIISQDLQEDAIKVQERQDAFADNIRSKSASALTMEAPDIDDFVAFSDEKLNDLTKFNKEISINLEAKRLVSKKLGVDNSTSVKALEKRLQAVIEKQAREIEEMKKFIEDLQKEKLVLGYERNELKKKSEYLERVILTGKL